MTDLCSSIYDGRWSEQKKRALATYRPDQLYYIIQVQNEKDIFEYQNRFSKIDCDALLSATMNLFLNYNIPYIYLQEMKNIVRYVYRLAIQCHKRVTTYDSNKQDHQYEHSYLGSIQSRKQKNMTSHMFFLHCLQGIPGVSTKTAKNISALFDESMSSFLDTLRDDRSCQVIPMLYKKAYGRSLNRTIMKNMYDLFFTDEHISNQSSISSQNPPMSP
jgi:ERCC4-type nuclease